MSRKAMGLLMSTSNHKPKMHPLEEQPKKSPTPNLVLHCGANLTTIDEVKATKTPKPTATWYPISHHTLIHTVTKTLKSAHLTVGTQAHSLSHNGNRYFGLLEIKSDVVSDDYCMVLGLRNSSDKTFPAGLCIGASVFVCDNLSFHSEIKVARKHTRHIARDLPQLVASSVGRLMERWHHQDERILAYKEAELAEAIVHDLVIRSVDLGVCPNRLVPSVLKEWRHPTYEVFQKRSVWSLFNSFTEVLKGNLAELPRRTAALHGLLDSYVGLN